MVSVAISHYLPQIVLRAFRPGPYPKDWWCSPCLPVQPPLTVVDMSVYATSLLAVVVRCIFCVFPPSQLCCSLRFQNSHRHTCERVSYCVETSLPSWLPPQDGSLSLNLLSQFLSFIFCPTSFWKDWAAFLGAWCPLPVFRSCFVEVAQHSNNILMNFGGRKWSPRPIPLPSWDCACFFLFVLFCLFFLIGE